VSVDPHKVDYTRASFHIQSAHTQALDPLIRSLCEQFFQFNILEKLFFKPFCETDCTALYLKSSIDLQEHTALCLKLYLKLY
jgi:hypothetical protein